MTRSHFVPSPMGKPQAAYKPALSADTQARHAQILGESLPFVQAMHGQTVVIAFLGQLLFDPAMRQRLVQDVALLALLGIRPVIVQGAAPHFHAPVSTTVGMMSREAATQVTRASIAEINLELVRQLNREGVRAVGLSGQDAHWATAVMDDTDSPRLDKIDPSLLILLQSNQMVPVLMSLAPTADEHDYLVQPERFAAQLAQALHAHSLLLVSNGDLLQQAGIPDGPVERRDMADWLSSHAAAKPASEIRAALEAIDRGVPTVHLLDANAPSAIVAELLTNEGVGTVLCRRSGAQLLADTARYFHDADSVIRPNFIAERKGVVRF